MLLCPTLRKVQLAYVSFDPTNTQHMEAFKLLCLGEKRPNGNLIRQHETLRFDLEDGFTDVRSMMFHKVGEHHLSNIAE